MKVTSSRRTSVSESKMPKWLPHPGVLITGDIVRWREPVWSEKPHKKKYRILGERRVTAAVLAMDSNGFLRLSILEDPMKRFKKDEVVRKKRISMARASAERLKRSDETARSLAVTRFLNLGRFTLRATETPQRSYRRFGLGEGRAARQGSTK
jgi:hypothetical protein